MTWNSNLDKAEDRSNQAILKEISPGISLEGMMLKLKLQYFGHLMRRADSLEKTDAGKDWRQEEKGTAEDEMVGWHHWHDGHEWVGSRSWWWTGKPDVLQSMGSQRVRQDWATEMNWEKVSATWMQQANSLNTHSSFQSFQHRYTVSVTVVLVSLKRRLRRVLYGLEQVCIRARTHTQAGWLQTSGGCVGATSWARRPLGWRPVPERPGLKGHQTLAD